MDKKLVHVQMPADNERVLKLLENLLEAVRLQPDRTTEVNRAYHEAKDYLVKKDEKAHV